VPRSRKTALLTSMALSRRRRLPIHSVLDVMLAGRRELVKRPRFAISILAGGCSPRSPWHILDQESLSLG
jgi:hypothetical protein